MKITADHAAAAAAIPALYLYEMYRLRTEHRLDDGRTMTQKQYAAALMSAALGIFAVVLKKHPHSMQQIKSAFYQFYRSLENRTRLTKDFAKKIWTIVMQTTTDVLFYLSSSADRHPGTGPGVNNSVNRANLRRPGRGEFIQGGHVHTTEFNDRQQRNRDFIPFAGKGNVLDQAGDKAGLPIVLHLRVLADRLLRVGLRRN